MADKITVKAFLEKRREADKKLLAELATVEKSAISIDELKELVLFASNSTFIKLEEDKDAFQTRYGVSLEDVLPDFRKPHVGLGYVCSTDFATLPESSYLTLTERYSFDTDNLVSADYLLNPPSIRGGGVLVSASDLLKSPISGATVTLNSPSDYLLHGGYVSLEKKDSSPYMVTPKTSPRDKAALDAIYVANSALDAYKSPSDFVWNQSAYVGSSDVVGKAITLGASVTPDWRIPLYSGGDIETLTRPVTVELTRYNASLSNSQENGLFTIDSLTKLDKPYRFDASAISLSPVTTRDSLVSDALKSPYSVSNGILLSSASDALKSPVYTAVGTLTSRDSLVSDWTKSPYSVSASDKLYPFVEHHRVEHPSIQRPSTSIDAVVAMVEVLSPKLVTAITPSILSSVEYTIDRKLNDWAEQFRTYSHSWDKESVRAEIQAPDGHIIRLQGTSENIKSLVQDLFMGTISKQVQDTNQKPIPTVMKDGWKAVFDWYYDVPKRVCDGLEMLSEMIGYSHGTVKNQHALYRAELK